MSAEIKMTKLAECAGCGAKVGAGMLAELLQGIPTLKDPKLLVGYDTSDDASVYQVSDDLAIVQTVDFFPPIVDDPFVYGQIAATNAISDVYAMGGEPKLGLNIMTVRKDMPKEAIHDILRGGYDKAYEAGVIITGGHTIQDQEPKYGLAITGFVHPGKILRNDSARAGDVLILTKPLGVGIITTAAKVDMADPSVYKTVVEQMRTLNKSARDAMVKYEVHSCTDVTGFSLLGHTLEMARGGNVTAVLESRNIPVLPGVLDLANMGILPEGLYRNRHFAESSVHAAPSVTRALQDVFYDPQTSGGLLIAVAEKDAKALLAELKDVLPSPAIVGAVEAFDGSYNIQIR